MIQVRPCLTACYPWLLDKLAATGSFACAGRYTDSSLRPRLLQHMQLSAGREKDGEVRSLEGEEV